MYTITIMKIIDSLSLSEERPEQLGDSPVWAGLKPRQSAPTRHGAPTTALDCVFPVHT